MLIRIRLTSGQQNVGKSMTTMNTLQDDLDDYDILCLQEPYILKNGKLGGLSRDVVAHYSQTRCRVAIAVMNRSISAMEIMTENNFIAVSIDLISKLSILVVSIYLPLQGEVTAEMKFLKTCLISTKKSQFYRLATLTPKACYGVIHCMRLMIVETIL